MTKTATKPYPEMVPFSDELAVSEVSRVDAESKNVDRLRLLWTERKLLARTVGVGVLLGTILAFLLPSRFESTTQLMPPDNQSSSGMAMMAAMMAKSGGGAVTGGAGALGGVAGDLLGLKSSGALFIGVLRSRTVEDRLIDKFDLRKVYGKRTMEDARRRLSQRTDISEDRKSGILTITVTDHDPERSSAIARAYVEELDRLVSQLSTSSAHKERVFLEERLKQVKEDLESAEKEFSQFSSKNTAIDIKEQGKAMVEAAADLQGQVIAAQSELEAYRQIYTENNVRVKTAEAKLAELQKQLVKLGGDDNTLSSPAGAKSELQYPSIRKLPLLGVTYADLYRRTKIDEVVFEALTQQCELAKVEEAKDIPSVKVLDVANVPEKRSFPPRLLIIFVFACFAIITTAFGVIARENWSETNPQSPGKLLVQEVFDTVKSQMTLSSRARGRSISPLQDRSPRK